MTFENFEDTINSFKTFEDAIRRISYSLSGTKYMVELFESDWYTAVDRMLDSFIDSYFTEEGKDLIYSFLFDSLEGEWGVTLWEVKEKDIFRKEKEKIEINLTTLKELWDYLHKDSDIYIL